MPIYWLRTENTPSHFHKTTQFSEIVKWQIKKKIDWAVVYKVLQNVITDLFLNFDYMYAKNTVRVKELNI